GHGAAVLDDKVEGGHARKLFADARDMMKKIIDGRSLTASGVVAFYPANTVNHEDIEIYTDDSRSEVLFTWRNLRQQQEKREGVDYKSLADYIAPKESGVADYIGMFAVTGGLGIEAHEKRFLGEGDDYSS